MFSCKVVAKIKNSGKYSLKIKCKWKAKAVRGGGVELPPLWGYLEVEIWNEKMGREQNY
jgi:hypothetical protein